MDGRTGAVAECVASFRLLCANAPQRPGLRGPARRRQQRRRPRRQRNAAPIAATALASRERCCRRCRTHAAESHALSEENGLRECGLEVPELLARRGGRLRSRSFASVVGGRYERSRQPGMHLQGLSSLKNVAGKQSAATWHQTAEAAALGGTPDDIASPKPNLACRQARKRTASPPPDSYEHSLEDASRRAAERVASTSQQRGVRRSSPRRCSRRRRAPGAGRCQRQRRHCHGSAHTHAHQEVARNTTRFGCQSALAKPRLRRSTGGVSKR